jgi:RimJ/RimL family protein N-acetyltransferase
MIYGERIRLRAIEREDLPRYVGWLNDPEVTAGLMTHFPMSMADETRWFENQGNRPVEERSLAIEVKTADAVWQHIGGTGFEHIGWVDRFAEFGICIGDKAFWNQGYGTEATRLMLKHGFETLNLHRIFLRVYENNPRAMRAYEKVGFVKEGIMRDAIYRNGCYINVLLMSVLRSEWNLIQKKQVKE